MRIKQSKTDPFCVGVYLFLGKTDEVICPIKGILPYLAIRGSMPAPSLLWKTKSVLCVYVRIQVTKLGTPKP